MDASRFSGPKSITIYVSVGPDFVSTASLTVTANARQDVVFNPGEIDFGYDIGLPPKTSYACLAETALLAMEGRFEDYTLGRQIDTERVKEIYRLFRKHGFQLAGLRSFDRYVTDDDVAVKRGLADELRQAPDRFALVQQQAAEQLARLPAMSKGVASESSTNSRKTACNSKSARLENRRFRRMVRGSSQR